MIFNPKVLDIHVHVFGLPEGIKQRIAVPIVHGKSTDVRIYGDQKDYVRFPLKIIILKRVYIPSRCPIHLSTNPSMRLLGRVVYTERNGEYIPNCMFSDNTSLITLENSYDTIIRRKHVQSTQI